MVPNSDTLCLAFESSGGKASVALSRGVKIIAHQDHIAPHGHAAWMITLARDVLASANVVAAECDVILAGRGPGSFTGIRVALAAAKGMGLALERPVFGLSSLEAMASTAANGKNPVAAITDTRRGSYFLQMFTAEGKPLSTPYDLSPEDVLLQLQEKGSDWIITGHVNTFPGIEGYKAHSLLPTEPDARSLCTLYGMMDDAQKDDCPPEPLYLAPPLLGPSRS